jgi:threonyl-tRNA synthetase
MLVVGDKEMESGQVAVRTRRGEDLGTMSIEDFVKHMNGEIQSKLIN